MQRQKYTVNQPHHFPQLDKQFFSSTHPTKLSIHTEALTLAALKEQAKKLLQEKNFNGHDIKFSITNYNENTNRKVCGLIRGIPFNIDNDHIAVELDQVGTKNAHRFN